MHPTIKALCFTTTLSLSGFTLANSLEIEFSLPEITTTEYEKPYVAIWTEDKGRNTPLMLWHMTKSKNDKWLPEIRRWWRKIGRYDTKLDGLTGATKGPGEYKKTFDIGTLKVFKLYLEVTRENGGRDLVKTSIDFSSGQSQYEIAATKELGPVKIKLIKE